MIRAPKTLIIAEAGVNHNGDLDLAKKMIEQAKYCGADYVKFQTFRADSLVTAIAPKAEYQIDSGNLNETQFQMLSQLELSREAHVELINHCKKLDIKFLSTAFDIKSLDMLNGFGIERIKIPSGEITNYPYLWKVGSFGKPVILSTGMSDLAEIEAAINTLQNAGVSLGNITVLHCTTAYPVPIKDVNLNAMLQIKHKFNVQVGYSDHTEGIDIALAAVAIGATVIEKHFTLDRDLPGPDHKASLEPKELKAMIESIRNIELSLGDGRKRVVDSEFQNRKVIRKSIVAASDIKKGELFSELNVTTKRPGDGISPMRWLDFIGKPAKRDFQAEEKIEE